MHEPNTSTYALSFAFFLVLCNAAAAASLPSAGAAIPPPAADRQRLRVGYYKSSCPQAESIVRRVVRKWFATDPSITAALLRMHFHDCFVRGCDASILINPTPQNPQPEKTAVPNKTVRAFNLIDAVKSAVESACPSTVSCADVVALATRDAVSLAGGPYYALPTGRLDGLVSAATAVKLPGPTISVYESFTKFFQPMGFTLSEMVILLGAHTVGVAHCPLFQDRVFNFMGTGRPDPSMDPSLVGKLRLICRGGGVSNATAALDQGTPVSFDGSYYKKVKERKGVMLIDGELGTDPSTLGIVSGFAKKEGGFLKRFGGAMVKLGGLVGSGGGEIRKKCGVFNNPN